MGMWWRMIMAADAPCPPAPPALVAVVNRAAQFVSSRIGPLVAPAACISQDIPDNLTAVAIPGAVFFPFRSATRLSRIPARWSPDDLEAVLHEVLHQYGWRNGLDWDGYLRWIEEGTVEAVAQDLAPVWIKSVTNQRSRVGVAYFGWVTTIRRASSAATGTPWRSSAAKQWRVRLLLTDPNQRDVALVSP